MSKRVRIYENTLEKVLYFPHIRLLLKLLARGHEKGLGRLLFLLSECAIPQGLLNTLLSELLEQFWYSIRGTSLSSKESVTLIAGNWKA